MTSLREERTEIINLLDSLKDQQKISHKPDMFVSAIKQTRRKILGMYKSALNSRTPVDTAVPEVV